MARPEFRPWLGWTLVSLAFEHFLVGLSMTLSALAFERHMAELTRYARAVSISDAMADAMVYCVFARLTETSASVGGSPDPRLVVYAEFHKLWLTLSARDPAGDRCPSASAWPPVEMSVFVMAALEGFEPSSIAKITGLSTIDVQAALTQWVGAAISIADFGAHPLGRTPRREAMAEETSFAPIQGTHVLKVMEEPGRSTTEGAGLRTAV